MAGKLACLAAACIAYAATSSSGVSAQDKPSRPVFDQAGVVHVPAFELPPSELMSRIA